jgi:hypothetical protein
MPTISDLIEHPKTFLKQYALWPAGILNVKCRGLADNRLFPLRMQPKSGVSCVNKAGVNMPCYELTEATSLGDMIPAYYLAYTPNSTQSITLGDKADLFITDTMTGCSFGAMSGSNPKVAHLNYTMGADPAAPIDQVKTGTEMTKVFGGPPSVQLNKTDYINAKGQNGNVTVVGVRKGNGWEFYYQRRNATGSNNLGWTYEIVSVHSVK